MTGAQYERLFRIHLLGGEINATMGYYFLGVALGAAVFGNTDIAGGAAAIAKLFVFLSSVMCVILFILGMAAEGRIP